MLDLFTIFSKGGIVLWCFQSTSQIFTPSVNALIRSVILQERTGNNSFDHDALTLKYKLDNEFELIYVIAFQKILQLSYVDKFLDDIHLQFRDRYKNDLQQGRIFQDFDFMDSYSAILAKAEDWGRLQAKIPRQMKTFEESLKSKKTVDSMIVRKGEEKKPGKSNKKKGGGDGSKMKAPEPVKLMDSPPRPAAPTNGELDEETLAFNRFKLAQKLGSPNAKKAKPEKQKSPKPKKTGKEPTRWDLGGTNKDLVNLERTTDKPEDENSPRAGAVYDTQLVGRMVGGIKDLEVESSSEEEEEDDEEEEEVQITTASKQAKKGGMFSIFRGLVGSKNLTREDMQVVLDKMKDLLIAKNVAADIANKLCESVEVKLEGKVLGTFEGVASVVKATLTESLVRILSPRRRIDILRDVMEAKRQGRPFIMAFCGVNGVGKSTNLAKICFWLIENQFRVLIAACDTFRAGAVEQLRTHTRHLNALHPAEKHGGQQMVQLYEKGYGKDAAGIAMEAINFARDAKVDVVLVDTAGRMQDNEPLMRALTKLIKVNEPDLVLFVGEALVGNEAVDQLVKFNQALADYSATANPHLIDGIVLTKFDTIDDKVS
ncbi:hypothetical protein B566_EDAN001371, partial [Ephemera danica]